ncbi:LiaF transmembrane domain-containing protein [Marinigracilibium pacificum]|uniref:Cell wall-active antibiotics response protein n=1 Tax=Marinigracilibium pacificum TaxID=2729599 RepID=A0A848IZB0_9BACT|nr:DUF5668 domain-containing protein [Marinigracilibium pacificum]NMM48966.1 cell wall-active antibiotics response protein [Marinigracilibium pacificum]
MKNRKAYVGIIILIIGFAFLLRNLGIDIIPRELFGWEMIFIAIGTMLLIGERNKTPGLIFLGIGSISLLNDFIDFPRISWAILWPSILIIIGTSIFVRHSGLVSSGSKKKVNGDTPSPDTIDDLSLFGGGDRYYDSQAFKGGKMTAIFGGSDIDLTDCKLAPGVHELNVFVMFGGIDLSIPPNWVVKNELSAAFGGYSDKRIKTDGYIVSETGDTERPVLKITGMVLMGGMEIRSYPKRPRTNY